MRRFLTLVFLLFLAIPAGITITGCYRNPAAAYCNGLGYGLKTTAVDAITLQPQYAGISMAYGQTRSVNAPSAVNCKGGAVSVGAYSYGTTNNQLVDISPTGNMCAGTWNRNSGGGIADFTICNYPSPLPASGGLPYNTAYITASAQSVTSNPVEVYIHAPVTSISLVGPSQCLSQSQVAQLDAQACYASNGTQYLMCAPSSVTSTNYACPLAPGVTSVPNCSAAIGTLSYTPGTASVASINAETNQITAELPGTTVITASVAGSGSSAGYFSTCPPQSISLSLNGNTTGTVTEGVAQNLVTTILDTNGLPITGLTLDYQSTNPLDVTAGATGTINANFPGSASVYAICQPTTCNPAPIQVVGSNQTGLSISSNPVNITVPGTASSYVWFAAPGQSQYYVPVDLLTGTLGSTVRLPYVPNSMVMDRLGTTLYFGSSHELMLFSTASNTLTGQSTSVPGVVLAVSPNNATVLVNDQQRHLFYLYNGSGAISATFGGMGVSAEWTPDAKTLYVSDSAAANNLPANIAAGVTGHTDTLYVYNVNTGWTTYPLPCSTASGAGTTCTASGATSNGAQSVAVTIPGVGAYLSGNPTVAHTWCPTGTADNYSSMTFYPLGDSVNADTDVLTATTDGKHILGAAATGNATTPGPIALSDIGVTVPTGACPDSGTATLSALTLAHTLNQTSLAVNATAVNQIVTSPAAVSQGTTAAATSLSFVTYTGTTAGATLPYYTQTTGTATGLGTVGYITLAGSTAVTAPIAGAFSPDSTLFFVSTSGDNQIHYISTTTLTDTQQISPNLPACTPGSDPGCLLTTPTTNPVPATVIYAKPRSTT